MIPERNIASPLTAGILLGVLGLVLLFSYSLYAALPFLQGPNLEVTVQAEAGTTVLFGTAERVSYLLINGSPVPLSEDGSFSVRRAYPVGYTAVTAVARDRFGREITKSLSVITTPHGIEEN